MPIYNQKTGDLSSARPVLPTSCFADGQPRDPGAPVGAARMHGGVPRQCRRHRLRVAVVFMVLATQNPIDMAGTHPLPEAQLDRFSSACRFGYPDLAEEVRILAAQALAHPIDALQLVIGEAEILAAREAVKVVHGPPTSQYMARISAATHPSGPATRRQPARRHGAGARITGHGLAARAKICHPTSSRRWPAPSSNTD